VFNALKFVKNGIELRKLWPFKLEGVNNSKNKPSHVIKASSQTHTKFLVCYFIIIRIQRRFVEL
jgi:hypothetical protein